MKFQQCGIAAVRQFENMLSFGLCQISHDANYTKTKMRKVKTMRELVDELERLANDVWFGNESESARRIEASDFCNLVSKVGESVAGMRDKAEIRYRAALEAFWADKARHFAESAPQGESAMRTVDANMAVAFAAVRIDTQRGELLRLLDFFALEFIKLTLAFYEPGVHCCEVEFECRDFLAAKKRVEAMKRLAGAIDGFANSNCNVEDIHKAIIAYSTDAGESRRGMVGETATNEKGQNNAN